MSLIKKKLQGKGKLIPDVFLYIKAFQNIWREEVCMVKGKVF
jgi:hypothetical protein